MTWHPTTPPWYRDAAEHACTQKQLEVLHLASHNLSDRKIANTIGVTRETIRGHLEAAHRRIKRELEENAA